MDHYKPRLYLTSAFIAGILLTLGFKDFYPDLERRFRQARAARLAKANGSSSSSSSSSTTTTTTNSSSSSSSTSAGARICDANENKDERIRLEDHTIAGGGGVGGGWDDKVVSDVRDGIEACVGNTPLFRIKSLSEETGCEIFAKAEVWKKNHDIPNILEE